MRPRRYNLPGSGLLSHSGMNTFLGCQKKYAFKYIDRVPPETGEEGPGALERGKAFHTLVETGGAGDIATDLQGDAYELVRVQSAYDAYEAHLQMGALPRVQFKEARLISDEHQFIGYVDGISEREDGSWMLTEMKTSQRFDPIQWATLRVNFQISLYTAFAMDFAHRELLDYDQLKGVSYQKIIFSAKKPLQPTKKKRPNPESPQEFAQRIAGDTKIHHQMVVPTDHAKLSAVSTFDLVKQGIHALGGNSRVATRNTQNCFAYGRVCEYFGHCHGVSFEDLEEDSATTRIANDLDEELGELA